MPSIIARLLWLLTLLTVLLFGLPGTDAAPTTVTVSITATGFTPVIALVTVGTRVAWHNADRMEHSATGSFWPAPVLTPGGSFSVLFKKIGQFPYHDGRHPQLNGTVVVLAAQTTPPTPSTPASTVLSSHYQATASLAVNERWTFYDQTEHATTGSCNFEVGGGSRVVHWSVHFPDVLYYRDAATEGLAASVGVPAKLAVYHEVQHAMISPDTGNNPPDCPFPPPTQNASCANDMAGSPLTMTLGWASITGTFLLRGADSYAPQAEKCGELNYASELVLVGVGLTESLQLPVAVSSTHLLYDSVETTALPEEIALLRRDQPVHVVRQLILAFTTPCCDGWAPHAGVPTRIGAIWHVQATLDMQLQPR